MPEIDSPTLLDQLRTNTIILQFIFNYLEHSFQNLQFKSLTLIKVLVIKSHRKNVMHIVANEL